MVGLSSSSWTLKIFSYFKFEVLKISIKKWNKVYGLLKTNFSSFQPLRLDIKRKLTARSDRVKCVDLHPTEPWMLCSLYNGNINVWNHENQQLVKTFEVCDLPVRAAKFVPRKNWVIAGSDDMHIRVFNYNTLDRVHAFEAHSDYVRCIVVHPTQPYILTSSGK